MKIKVNFLLLIGCLVLSNCTSKTVDNNSDPDSEDPILTSNITVYEPALMHNNSVVLAIENGGTTAYLVNREGEKLFIWNFPYNLGNDLELLPNGNVLGMFKSADPQITFGGWGGLVKIIAPDGSVVWEYDVHSENFIGHHDVEMLPNGNVLILLWEKITAAEAQQSAANTDVDVFTEKLIEVDPDTDEVVWEWRSWDHFIQDVDSNLSNFGSVSENPQRININYRDEVHGAFMHANGIDYDSEKDVIYISINLYSEVWVIDHSTTTEEATSTSGGNFNKGGDLLYRFGNPSAYNNSMGEIRFDKNHFPNLLENGEIGEGNMLVYANGISAGQSTVYELQLPEVFALVPNQDNEPLVIWSFTDPNMFSDKLSGAVRLSNGNTLICEGDFGYWEITPNGDIAWQYDGMGPNFWRGYVYDNDHPALPLLGLIF